MTITSFRQRAGDLLRELFDVVFPPVCAGCGQPGHAFCHDCITQTPAVIPPWCATCGHTTHRPVFRCRNCRHDVAALAQIFAPFYHAGPMLRAIQRFKYRGSFGLSQPFATCLADHLPTWQQPPDILVPVPLHPVRERERGYNQAQLLAEDLSKLISLPVDSTSLDRIRDTRPQVGLNFQDRRRNVAGAFRAKHGAVEARHYLLIDDVLTTGATLSAAAAALRDAGALSVAGYCLARARRNP